MMLQRGTGFSPHQLSDFLFSFLLLNSESPVHSVFGCVLSGVWVCLGVFSRVCLGVFGCV